MGVYGDIQRHDGNNAGTFTILMNQDYVGLEAEVGYRIDDGIWQVGAMSYAGHMDGNSIWSYAPSEPFPAGSTVTYYFHGWDLWGGNIWDSNNGNDYRFEVAGGTPSTIAAGPLQEFDPGFDAGFAAAAIDGHQAYAAADGPDGNIVVGRRQLSEDTWGSWTDIPGTDAHHLLDITMAGADMLVFSGTSLDLYVHQSFDGWIDICVTDCPSRARQHDDQSNGYRLGCRRTCGCLDAGRVFGGVSDLVHAQWRPRTDLGCAGIGSFQLLLRQPAHPSYRRWPVCHVHRHGRTET